MANVVALMSLLGFLGVAGCQGDSAGAPRTEAPDHPDGGGADHAALGVDVGREDSGDSGSAVVDAPVPPPVTDAALQFQATCTARTGVDVAFTQPRLHCDGYPRPFGELVVLNSAAQLDDLVRKYPCLTDLPAVPISFETSRLVLVPVEGEVTWAGQVGGAILLGVSLYQGPAPGTQPYPAAAILPRSDSPVRALVCAPPLSCNPCPP